MGSGRLAGGSVRHGPRSALAVQPRGGRRVADLAAGRPALRRPHRLWAACCLLLDALGLPPGVAAVPFGWGMRLLEWTAERAARRDISSPDASALGRARRRSAARGRGSGPFGKDACRGGLRSRGGLSGPGASARPRGPGGGVLHRGPRRGPGRRDTPALERQGGSRGRRRSLRRGLDRFRAHAPGAQAARPRSDATGCGAADPSASGPRPGAVRRTRGASGGVARADPAERTRPASMRASTPSRASEASPCGRFSREIASRCPMRA